MIHIGGNKTSGRGFTWYEGKRGAQPCDGREF